MSLLRRPAAAAGRLSAAVVLAASCTGGIRASSGAPLPRGAPVIDVTMREMAFDHTKEIPPGLVVFRVHNAGAIDHRLTMLRLPDDFPPLDAQLKGSERRPISPFVGIYDREPGQDGTFAVNLAPGQRYGFVCFINDEGGSHAVLGMSSEFRAATPPLSR